MSAVRAISVRYRAVFWVAAIALIAIAQALDLDPPYLGYWIFLTTIIAAVASVNGVILDTHRDRTAEAAKELADATRRLDGEIRPFLRRAK